MRSKIVYCIFITILLLAIQGKIFSQGREVKIYMKSDKVTEGELLYADAEYVIITFGEINEFDISGSKSSMLKFRNMDIDRIKVLKKNNILINMGIGTLAGALVGGLLGLIIGSDNSVEENKSPFIKKVFAGAAFKMGISFGIIGMVTGAVIGISNAEEEMDVTNYEHGGWVFLQKLARYTNNQNIFEELPVN